MLCENLKKITSGPFVESIKIENYREYLEEASFLYEHRMNHFLNQEFSWSDIGDIEKRFEAYISGLFIGDELAIRVCCNTVTESDNGEFHAAMRVLLRHRKKEMVQAILNKMDWSNEDKVFALTEAFKHELPIEWLDILENMLTSLIPQKVHSASKVIGFKRFPLGTTLLTILNKEIFEDASPIIWALGRLKEESASKFLLNFLKTGTVEERYEAAMAILRTGKVNIIDLLISFSLKEDWALLPLGFCGDKHHLDQLHKIGAGRTVDDHYTIALGLMGDVSSLTQLVNMLIKPDVAASAALALQMITGADIHEEVFIPEEIHEDELFEHELEKLKRGEPLYSEGEEPGETIKRLTQNPDQWITWWRENSHHFQNNTRYRMGHPFSLSAPYHMLLSRTNPNILRKLALEELAIRYQKDIPMETDMLVINQMKIFKETDCF